MNPPRGRPPPRRRPGSGPARRALLQPRRLQRPKSPLQTELRLFPSGDRAGAGPGRGRTARRPPGPGLRFSGGATDNPGPGRGDERDAVEGQGRSRFVLLPRPGRWGRQSPAETPPTPPPRRGCRPPAPAVPAAPQGRAATPPRPAIAHSPSTSRATSDGSSMARGGEGNGGEGGREGEGGQRDTAPGGAARPPRHRGEGAETPPASAAPGPFRRNPPPPRIRFQVRPPPPHVRARSVPLLSAPLLSAPPGREGRARTAAPAGRSPPRPLPPLGGGPAPALPFRPAPGRRGDAASPRSVVLRGCSALPSLPFPFTSALSPAARGREPRWGVHACRGAAWRGAGAAGWRPLVVIAVCAAA